MKKFKVHFEWYASMRGYDEVEVEANSPEEAEELYLEQANIDYNAHAKLIDYDREVISVTEPPELQCRCPEGEH